MYIAVILVYLASKSWASCLVDDKASLVCCGTASSVSIDTASPELCSGGACKTGSYVNGIATFVFDYVFVSSGVSVVLDGDVPLVLKARYGMTLDGGIWNGTAEV